MKVIIGLLLAMVAAASLNVYAVLSTPAPHDTAVYLEFTDGFCSGTVVGPHTILTGTHCTNDGPLKAINDTPARSLGFVHDGHDHTLMTVDRTFKDIAKIHQRRLAQSEAVRYWGNPNEFRDAYREGYVLGFCNVPEQCLGALPSIRNVNLQGLQATAYSTPGWAGDSGSGVFDSEGYVVTTVSAIMEISPTLYPMMSFEMVFTPEQLAAIR